MEQQSTILKMPAANYPSADSVKTNYTIIGVLVVLLLFSLLGINLLKILGNIGIPIATSISEFIVSLLSMVGYTSGAMIDKTADITASASKTGIDIMNGSLHSIGGLLINANEPTTPKYYKSSIDTVLNTSPLLRSQLLPPQPQPSPSENPIQKPISANKVDWCLVGEYMGKRGCVELAEGDKCMSGQVFNSKEVCETPKPKH
jgi:hypothetical protein